MSWIITPIAKADDWPEKTPDGVAVSPSQRVTNTTHTGCGYPWSARDRAALLAIPGAFERPVGCAAVANKSWKERCAHHAATPGEALIREGGPGI